MHLPKLRMNLIFTLALVNLSELRCYYDFFAVICQFCMQNYDNQPVMR